jgi:two-component system sensor histidine kinase TctE
MFAPLLLLWPMSVSLTYLVAQSIASEPYDHALVERGESLAAYVQVDAGRTHLAPAGEAAALAAPEGASYLIVLDDGHVVAGDADLPHPPPPARARPGAGADFQLQTQTLRGHPVRVASAWIDGAGGPAVLVAVAEPTASRTALANEIVKGVILPQFIVLPLALLLVWFGLSRGLAPVTRLQQVLRSRAPEDLSPVRAESAPEELVPLVRAFNELLARVARGVDVHKRFIADAAHQMKTPLAGLRTQAELAQRAGSDAELGRSLQQITTATLHATRMIDQLLSLARAEHGAAPGTGELDLTVLVPQVVQDWVESALAQGIDLGYEAPGDQTGLPATRAAEGAQTGTAADAARHDGADAPAAPGAAVDWRILGAPLLLRELLGNLVDNALRYARTPENAQAAGADAPLPTVTVRLCTGAGGERLLEVEDSGPGVPEAERERIFERFYRVLGSGREGSGLGLAIVREIARRHGASVEVDGARAFAGGTGPGACFRVRFPPAGGRDGQTEANAMGARSA